MDGEVKVFSPLLTSFFIHRYTALLRFRPLLSYILPDTKLIETTPEWYDEMSALEWNDCPECKGQEGDVGCPKCMGVGQLPDPVDIGWIYGDRPELTIKNEEEE